MIDAAADKIGHHNLARLDIRTLADRRHQFGELILRFALAAPEGVILDFALAIGIVANIELDAPGCFTASGDIAFHRALLSSAATRRR